jgi:putative heme-binding domain-containing protein
MLCQSRFGTALRAPRFALTSVLCLLSSVFSAARPCFAQDDPFAAGVRTTPWLKPEEEQKAFKLPPGFEIQLVAAEPDIQKPLNMAFDERGRIWLTCSVEYPYAAPLDKPGRDSIRVLEDTDGDGRFEKVTVFADGLNIPIGIYPWKGGCIAWSIPNIWHFEDTDGDGMCDKRTVLYGPFDHTRDVHGNCNAFRRGFDGWVYACHGFNNDSHVKGRDGHEVHLNSGNTFRFRLDGSRIEHFTHGQVNPFGMCFDELFNIFTADCHSKPLTQLIRGGYYPSFGKPHDGLGFVPSMMDHLHGSTAICGVVKYSGENFPPEYRGDFLSGNVMTSRINRNQPEYHGSTIKAIEQPDFLSTTDPWFRPVDLQIGPDGALYILDFYNRIIGHYEVPLPHPGRDRTSGRIWRVVYAGKGTVNRGQETEDGAVGNAVPGVPGGGKDTATKPAKMPGDLTKMSVENLIEQLDSPQLEHRLRVQHYIADVVGPSAKDSTEAAWKRSKSSNQQIALLWLLDGFHALDHESFSYIVGEEGKAAKVRAHALLAVGNSNALSTKLLNAHVIGLTDKDPSVRRAAASSPRQFRSRPDWLVEALQSVPEDDALLRQSIRISIRDSMNLWRSEHGSEYAHTFAQTVPTMLEPLSGIAAVSESPGAVNFVLALLDEKKIELNLATLDVTRMARVVDAASVARLISAIRRSAGNDPQEQAQAIQLLQVGLSQSGKTNEQLSTWGTEVARLLLKSPAADAIGWTAVPVEGKPPSENPWVIAPRPCQDGTNDQPFYYSLPKGEQRTGSYRSAAFEIPAKLSFWCAGHSGFPGEPLNDGNWVRLRDATTHAVLAESRPPRNDTAQQIEWDLKEHAGKQGYVELVDGDTANAYAWLAVGRFSLAGLNPSETAKKQHLAAEIVGKLRLTALKPQLATLVAAPSTDGAARAAIGQALVALDPDSRAAALVAALNDPSIPDANRVKMGYAITVDADGEYLENLREVMKRAPSRLQTTIAETLAGDATGADALLALVESGHAAPRLLLAANVSSKLETLNNTKLAERVAAATAKLPPVSDTLDKLILQRRLTFAKAAPNLEKGQAVFTKHCAACHQVAGQGAVVGPQLDGIGNRGLERIIEDVLDPNRNVDVAFRTTTLRLEDGRVLSGLFRRAEGTQQVFADNLGKEFTVAKDEISQEQKTALSLMPANVPEIVPAEEFNDLVGWLLSQRQAAKK